MVTGKNSNECLMKGGGLCPLQIENILTNFRNKWSLPILITIGNFSSLHFNLIKRKMSYGSNNISSKVLSEKLKNLVKSGFITSREQDVYPFKIKYSLTDKGEGIYKKFSSFSESYETGK